MNKNTKYGFTIPLSSIKRNISRLTNQIWKLIPMREHEENWEEQLEIVILDISGLSNIFIAEPLFLQLLAKLETLKNHSLVFETYRKTVFEAIGLLQGMIKDEQL